jgi:lipopolysaccharide/colanic/teichoic acid biosynthesis glycosyltransferase
MGQGAASVVATLAAVPVGAVDVRPLSLPERCLKRGQDIVVSAAGLILLSPLMALIAFLVKLTSPGPVFYRWRVVGEGGRPFVGYKFRSMREDADALKSMLLPRNEMTGPVFKMKDDPRVTAVGRRLRRCSLDELPQLWSVLKGDMSLVGPRPPLQSEYERFTPWQKAKILVRPGITCLWQVNGRSDIRDFDDWVRIDLDYASRRSFLLDLKIMAMTIPAVLRGRGAR